MYTLTHTHTQELLNRIQALENAELVTIIPCTVLAGNFRQNIRGSHNLCIVSAHICHVCETLLPICPF